MQFHIKRKKNENSIEIKKLSWLKRDKTLCKKTFDSREAVGAPLTFLW